MVSLILSQCCLRGAAKGRGDHHLPPTHSPLAGVVVVSLHRGECGSGQQPSCSLWVFSLGMVTIGEAVCVRILGCKSKDPNSDEFVQNKQNPNPRNLWVVCGLVAKSCLTLATPWTVACQAPHPWDSPGKNTGVGCLFLLLGIFLTQELSLGLLSCRQILYQLS